LVQHQERSLVAVTMQTHPLDWQVWRRRLVGAILVLGLLSLLYGPYCAWQTCRHLLQLRADLSSLRSLSPSQLDSLAPKLANLQRDVALIRRDLSFPLAVASHLGWLPLIGPTVQAGPELFAAGESLLVATATTWEVLEELASAALDGDPDTEQMIAALSAQVVAHKAQLQEATASVHEACDRILAIDASRLLPRLAPQMTRLQSLTPLLAAAFDGLLLLPELLSRPGEQTYLLLAQNNDELRPTGGFISSIGTVTVAQGLFHLGPFVDSYRVEDWSKPHPDPPDPLREHMGLDLWVTRDANWWPDFTTSARAVADLYELNQEKHVDGVVAIDMAAAARLLETLAPLRLANGEHVERGQVAEAFQRSWGLPEGSLVTSGVVITATRPFSAIELELTFGRGGRAWFDTVVLEDLQRPGLNLVSNPSFEDDVDGDGLPDHWESLGLATGDCLATEYAHTGQTSLVIAGEPGTDKTVVQRIPYSGEAGTSFRLSAESRGEEILVKGGSYALSATFLYDQGQPKTVVAGFPFFTHDWATAGSDKIMARWWSRRKDFVHQMVQAAFSQVLTNPSGIRWLDLLTEISALLNQRHIQIYMSDSSLQTVFQRNGWSGALVKAPGDYLLVVDTNVGYNKVSTNIEQSIDYRVEIDASRRARATLSIRYHNLSTTTSAACEKWKPHYTPTYESLTQGCYWDYVRIYVPAGAELESGEGGDQPIEVSSELGRTVLATLLMLRPGEHRELLIKYSLPVDTIRDDTYRLYVQKQSGTDCIPLRIQVALPRARKAHYEGLEPDELAPDVATYHSDLLVDRDLVIRLPR